MSAQPRLEFRSAEHEWWLWWPCARCGGAAVPLLAQLRDGGLDESHEPALSAVRDHPCPGCETRRRRALPEPSEPQVWYDTDLIDWVLRLPIDGRSSAILPLEIRWFDAPAQLVHVAAADLAFAGGLLDP